MVGFVWSGHWMSSMKIILANYVGFLEPLLNISESSILNASIQTDRQINMRVVESLFFQAARITSISISRVNIPHCLSRNLRSSVISKFLMKDSGSVASVLTPKSDFTLGMHGPIT